MVHIDRLKPSTGPKKAVWFSKREPFGTENEVDNTETAVEQTSQTDIDQRPPENGNVTPATGKDDSSQASSNRPISKKQGNGTIETEVEKRSRKRPNWLKDFTL